jgi:methyl-accepting chemotaxis protein
VGFIHSLDRVRDIGESMTRKLSLKQKLIASFLSIALILFVVGGIGIGSLSKVRAQYRQVTEVSTPKTEQLLKMRTSMESLLSTMIQMGLYGNPPDEIEKLGKRLASARESYTSAEKAYQAMKYGDGEKELYDKVAEKWGGVLGNIVDVMQLARSSEAKDKIAFGETYRKPEFEKARADFYEALDTLVAFQSKHAKEWEESAQYTAKMSNIFMAIAMAVGVFVAMLVGWIISAALSNNLRSVADELSTSADQLAGFANEIAEASQSLLSSIEHQVTAIHETSAAVDQLSSMVGKNSDNAASSRDVSVKSDDAANQGRQSVEQMIVAIDDIDKSNSDMMVEVSNNNKDLSEINQVIHEINSKTKVINDIVFQTKLLSFNASVEAARAGEAGKGFAVVAEEVGNLAQMSGTAAREITDMLQQSVQKVDKIIELTTTRIERIVNENRTKVSHGKEVASQCGQVLEQVVSNVQRVRSMLEEISVASREQATGIEEITRAMSSLNESTQKNATSSNKANHTSSELARQADMLHQLVKNLWKTVYGDRAQKISSKKAADPSSHVEGSGTGEQRGHSEQIAA